jgi:predicted outer membrane repeat protein
LALDIKVSQFSMKSPLILFVLLFITEKCIGCVNYASVKDAQVSTYADLSDAIDCCVANITVTESITVSSELNFVGCNGSLHGTVDSVALYAPNSRVFNVDRSTLEISSITLQGNAKLNLNGGILSAARSAIIMRGVIVQSGWATNGGAVAVDNSTVAIVSSKFTGNRATALGGAVYCSAGGSVSLRGVTISGSSAFSGGSVAVDTCSLTLTDTQLDSSFAQQYGGCIYSYFSALSLVTSSLTGCQVAFAVSGLEEDSQGGCLFATSRSAVNMSHSSLTKCSASTAGILKLSASSASIDTSEFRDSFSSNSNMDLVGRLTEVTMRSSRFVLNR